MSCQTAPDAQFPWQFTLGCTSRIIGLILETITVLSNDQVISTSAGSVYGGLNAFSYQVRFQSTDFPKSSSVRETPSAYFSKSKSILGS